LVRAAAAITIAWLALTPAARAQQVQATVTMRADRTAVEVGTIFRVEVRAHVVGAGDIELAIPDFSAFDELGAQGGVPIGFGFPRGGNLARHVESTTVQQFTLRARQPGTFRIAPAAAIVGGQRFESDPLTIEVTGTALPGAVIDPADPSAPAEALPPANAIDSTVFDPEGFVRTYIDPSEPFVGQQTTITIYLYSRNPVRAGAAITHEPTTEGFWVHDLMPPERQLLPHDQEVRGLHFYVYVLRRLAAFPLRAGELTVGPTTVTVNTGSAWDVLTGQRSAPFVRSGVPATVNVRELPAEQRPPGEVHVGTLALTTEIDRTQVPTGDAVQLTLFARGTGQLQLLNLALPATDGLRVLDPEIEDQIGSPSDIVGGTRRLRWLIVAEQPGRYSLGPFEVPVFDPITQRYSIARAPAIVLEAAGNAVPGDEAEDEESPSSTREATLAIAAIRTRSELSREASTSLLEMPWTPYLFAIGPALLIGTLAIRTVRRRMNGAALRSPKQGARDARKRLAAARKYAAANDPRAFYGAIVQALKEMMEAKLERSVGSLTHPELRRALADRGVGEALGDRIVDELEGCDFARFSAAGVRGEEMERCLGRTRELLEELDRAVLRAKEAA
jgi:hypothetical protein